MGSSLDLLKSPQEPAAAWEKRGAERRKEGNDDVMDRIKMERISVGGWHLTDKEIAGDMTLKDVSLSNIGEVTKSHKWPFTPIMCAQCAVVIIWFHYGAVR